MKYYYLICIYLFSFFFYLKKNLNSNLIHLPVIERQNNSNSEEKVVVEAYGVDGRLLSGKEMLGLRNEWPRHTPVMDRMQMSYVTLISPAIKTQNNGYISISRQCNRRPDVVSFVDCFNLKLHYFQLY